MRKTKSDDAELITELCGFIAKRLENIWNLGAEPLEDMRLKPGYFWHEAASTWEDACHTLWVLGLALAGDNQKNIWEIKYEGANSGWYDLFRPIVLQSYDDVIDFTHYATVVSLKSVLKSFVELATDFGCSLPACRHQNFFAISRVPESAIKTLVRNNFLDSSSEGYWWTDKIAPTMLELCLWNYDDVLLDLANLKKVDYWLDVIDFEKIQQLPRSSNGLYLGPSTNDPRVLAWELLSRWDGKNFTSEFKLRELLSFDEAWIVAQRLLQRYDHNDMVFSLETAEQYHSDFWVRL